MKLLDSLSLIFPAACAFLMTPKKLSSNERTACGNVSDQQSLSAHFPSQVPLEPHLADVSL